MLSIILVAHCLSIRCICYIGIGYGINVFLPSVLFAQCSYNSCSNWKHTHNQLPVADDMGRCNEANSVGFDVSVPVIGGSENACAREVENLEDECSLAFGWDRFSGDLYAGTSGTVSPAASFDGDDYVQVNGGSVLLLAFGSRRFLAMGKLVKTSE